MNEAFWRDFNIGWLLPEEKFCFENACIFVILIVMKYMCHWRALPGMRAIIKHWVYLLSKKKTDSCKFFNLTNISAKLIFRDKCKNVKNVKNPSKRTTTRRETKTKT